MSCREATPYQCQYVPIPFSRQQGPAYSYESHLEETILDRCNSCAASPGMAADEVKAILTKSLINPSHLYLIFGRRMHF
jgi:hypothetical protein